MIWFPSFRAPHCREETLAEKRRMKEQQEEKKLKAPLAELAQLALDPCGSGQLDFGDHPRIHTLW